MRKLISVQTKLLYKTRSPFSGEIKIIQKGYEKQLVVGGLVQSVSADTPDVSQRVWGKAVALIAERSKTPNSCLLLGLGGGTMAHLLSEEFSGIQIDAVEIDPIIIRLAREYFELRQLANLHIIGADAREVVKSPQSFGLRFDRYSVIIIDAYWGEVVPEGFCSPVFISSLKKLLSSGGLLVFNRIYSPKYQDEVRFCEDVLNSNFSRVEMYPVTGLSGSDNLLFVCSGSGER